MKGRKAEKNPPLAGKVKKCRITEKRENTYGMICRIHQRGEHFYYYIRGNGRLIKPSEKELLLDEDGLSVIENAADRFDVAETYMRNPSSKGIIRADFDKTGIALYLRHSGKERYDILLEILSGQDAGRIEFISDIPGCEILHEVRFRSPAGIGSNEEADRLFNPGPDDMEAHPLYTAAVRLDDKQLKAELELYYGRANSETVRYLRKTLGHYYLIRLPEEYDRTYVVRADTVSAHMLTRSGYRILHRPYFSMRGSTHENWELNPHKKTGVDAAPLDAEPITFKEFLNMFYKIAPPVR